MRQLPVGEGGDDRGAGPSSGGLLLSRDSHKSVVGGLIVGGIQPRWVTPQWDAERHMSHPPSPEQIRDGWEKYPDAAGALIVSPSPYGTCADIEGIAEVCHERGKPLIVDEAWGAHLPFHDDLPTWAMNAGADVCVVSVHKMGAGFEQGSVFHTQGDLSGDQEARLAYLAVHAWYGWSAGRLLVLDIGGGSMELALGRNTDPDIALSLPLGANRLTRRYLESDPPTSKELKRMRGTPSATRRTA